MKPLVRLLVALTLPLSLPSCFAQDAKGCADLPVLTRFPGSVITNCDSKPDDAMEVRTNKERKKIEGEIHRVDYNLPKGASQAQFLRNVKTAMTMAGFTQDFDSGNGDLTYRKNGTWVVITSNMGGTFYSVWTVKEIQLKQEMFADAAALSGGLASDGHIIAHGIFFDTGKSEVKPESAPALQEIAKLLQQDPKLKLYVVGHTDTVGAVASNLELSKQRAAAVVQALTGKYGIAGARLQPYGVGPYAPIASNDTEDGRAQNRRVELVKQ
jgi:OOP family OmpA-OmpF porin